MERLFLANEAVVVAGDRERAPKGETQPDAPPEEVVAGAFSLVIRARRRERSRNATEAVVLNRFGFRTELRNPSHPPLQREGVEPGEVDVDSRAERHITSVVIPFVAADFAQRVRVEIVVFEVGILVRAERFQDEEPERAHLVTGFKVAARLIAVVRRGADFAAGRFIAVVAVVRQRGEVKGARVQVDAGAEEVVVLPNFPTDVFNVVAVIVVIRGEVERAHRHIDADLRAGRVRVDFAVPLVRADFAASEVAVPPKLERFQLRKPNGAANDDVLRERETRPVERRFRTGRGVGAGRGERRKIVERNREGGSVEGAEFVENASPRERARDVGKVGNVAETNVV